MGVRVEGGGGGLKVGAEGGGRRVEGRVDRSDPSRYERVHTVCKHVQDHIYH